jgi:hypothetical protein
VTDERLNAIEKRISSFEFMFLPEHGAEALIYLRELAEEVRRLQKKALEVNEQWRPL